MFMLDKIGLFFHFVIELSFNGNVMVYSNGLHLEIERGQLNDGILDFFSYGN